MRRPKRARSARSTQVVRAFLRTLLAEGPYLPFKPSLSLDLERAYPSA